MAPDRKGRSIASVRARADRLVGAETPMDAKHRYWRASSRTVVAYALLLMREDTSACWDGKRTTAQDVFDLAALFETGGKHE